MSSCLNNISPLSLPTLMRDGIFEEPVHGLDDLLLGSLLKSQTSGTGCELLLCNLPCREKTRDGPIHPDPKGLDEIEDKRGFVVSIHVQETEIRIEPRKNERPLDT